MINQIKLDNFGPLSKINWPALGKMHVVRVFGAAHPHHAYV